MLTNDKVLQQSLSEIQYQLKELNSEVKELKQIGDFIIMLLESGQL